MALRLLRVLAATLTLTTMVLLGLVTPTSASSSEYITCADARANRYGTSYTERYYCRNSADHELLVVDGHYVRKPQAATTVTTAAQPTPQPEPVAEASNTAASTSSGEYITCADARANRYGTSYTERYYCRNSGDNELLVMNGSYVRKPSSGSAPVATTAEPARSQPEPAAAAPRSTSSTASSGEYITCADARANRYGTSFTERYHCRNSADHELLVMNGSYVRTTGATVAAEVARPASSAASPANPSVNRYPGTVRCTFETSTVPARESCEGGTLLIRNREWHNVSFANHFSFGLVDAGAPAFDFRSMDEIRLIRDSRARSTCVWVEPVDSRGRTLNTISGSSSYVAANVTRDLDRVHMYFSTAASCADSRVVFYNEFNQFPIQPVTLWDKVTFRLY